VQVFGDGETTAAEDMSKKLKNVNDGDRFDFAL
jgi:hypothetical protein